MVTKDTLIPTTVSQSSRQRRNANQKETKNKKAQKVLRGISVKDLQQPTHHRTSKTSVVFDVERHKIV